MEFGRDVAEVAVGHGRITRGWMMSFNGMVQMGMMEFGRGGACVPARVALQGRIHRSSPAHNACIFGMETPLRGRSGGHTGTAPTIPNTCKQAVSPKPKGFLLAETLQASNRSGIHLQERCKRQTVREYICRNAASAKPFGNAFAETLQASNRSGMHLQKRCERQTVREFICRNAASVRKSGITLWYRQFLY